MERSKVIRLGPGGAGAEGGDRRARDARARCSRRRKTVRLARPRPHAAAARRAAAPPRDLTARGTPRRAQPSRPARTARRTRQPSPPAAAPPPRATSRPRAHPRARARPHAPPRAGSAGEPPPEHAAAAGARARQDAVQGLRPGAHAARHAAAAARRRARRRPTHRRSAAPPPTARHADRAAVAAPGRLAVDLRGPAPAPSAPAPSQPAPRAGERIRSRTQARTRPSGQQDAVMRRRDARRTASSARRPRLRARADDAAAGRHVSRRGAPGSSSNPRAPRDGAHPVPATDGSWGGVLDGARAAAGGRGGGVHLFFIPLDVLITWRSPAGLAITTHRPAPP